MYTLLKPIEARKKLLDQKIKIFTPELFSRVFNTSLLSTKHFLEKQTKSGFLIRLKKGLYGLKTDMPTEEEIANQLYQPSYISLEYALAFYGLIPEMLYTVTSVTTKTTRSFNVNSIDFMYRSVKKEFFVGYSLVNKNNSSFLMADKEKAYLDYCYFAFLDKKELNDRLISRVKGKLDMEKYRKYLSVFKNQAFINFVNSI